MDFSAKLIAEKFMDYCAVIKDNKSVTLLNLYVIIVIQKEWFK